MSGLTLSVSLATDASDSDATAETVTPAHSVASSATGDGLVSTHQLRWQGQMLTMARLLGSGKFANVYELVPNAPEQEASKLVAKVTTLANLSPWARVQLKQEEEIWRSLSHPNIVRCYGYLLDTTQHVLLIERAPGGELFEWIMDAQGSFDEAQAARQVHQVLNAVEHMHARGVLHRDLKPENLLLASADADAAIKVADFGASKRVSTATTPRLGAPTTPCGSLGYAAPEQLRSGGPQATYDAAVDLWSVGVITYILLSGTMPFDPSTYGDKSLRVTFPEATFSTISVAAREFIVALLQARSHANLAARTPSRLAHPPPQHASLLPPCHPPCRPPASHPAAPPPCRLRWHVSQLRTSLCILCVLTACLATALAQPASLPLPRQVEPTRRLSAAEALKDPWLRTASLRVDLRILEQMPPVSAPPTPLATPGRLRELRASGQLQQQWAHQADEYVRQAEHHAAHAHGGRWVERPEAASGHARDAALVVETGVEVVAGAGADLGAAAAKRMHGEEEITLMLPPEVHKRLKGQRPAAQPAAPL